MAPHHARASLAPIDREQGPDISGVVGLAVVSLVAILGTAALMRFARSSEGWDIAHRLGLPADASGPIQGGLALLCAVFAGWRVRQGIRGWGDADGGRAGAIFNAAVAGGAFFAALELVRLAW